MRLLKNCSLITIAIIIYLSVAVVKGSDVDDGTEVESGTIPPEFEGEETASFASADIDHEAEIPIEVSNENPEPNPTRRRSSVLTINIDSSESESYENDTSIVTNIYEDVNSTAVNGNNTTNGTVMGKSVVNTTVVCLRKELPVFENGSLIESYVELVNATVLHTDVLWINSSIKTRSTPSNCSIVLFYAHWCPFSAKAAPHFNALPLAFPHLRVAAIDSTEHSSVNSFFGILSVPTILLFHNGKTVAKFNDTSLTLDKFAAFIHAFTDLRSAENFNLTSVPDNRGPLSSVATETRDVWLYLAWIFIVLCFFHYAAKSTLWKKVSDLVRTTWREAEAQHEHTD